MIPIELFVGGEATLKHPVGDNSCWRIRPRLILLKNRQKIRSVRILKARIKTNPFAVCRNLEVLPRCPLLKLNKTNESVIQVIF